MIRCKTCLSINGQKPIECMPITPDAPMGLCIDGTAHADLADAILKIDEHQELVIVKNSDLAVMLERGGRKLTLRFGKAIRVCENDMIWLNNTSIRIVKSTFVIDQTPVFSRCFHATRQFLSASAVVCSMMALSACTDHDTAKNVSDALSCDAGQMKCDGDKLLSCSDGNWVHHETCKSPAVCIKDSDTMAHCSTGGVDTSKKCTPGSMKCDGNAAMKCSDKGVWEVSEICSAEDNCREQSNTSAVCHVEPLGGDMPPMVCNPGEMKCDDNKVLMCNSDSYWDVAKTCNPDEYCHELSNTSAVCDIDVTSGTAQAPQCDPGEMKCDDQNVMKCDNEGFWQLDRTCDAGEICQEHSNTSAVCAVSIIEGEPMPPSCNPGEMKCDNKQVLKCSDDGYWDVANTCSDYETCKEISNTSVICEVEVLAGDTAPMCEPDEIRCEDNKIMKCNDGVEWIVVETCPNDAICREISNTSAICEADILPGILPVQECAPDEMKCDGNSVLKCSDMGTWTLETNCSDGTYCIEISNTSAVCDVDRTDGEMIPPELPPEKPEA